MTGLNSRSGFISSIGLIFYLGLSVNHLFADEDIVSNINKLNRVNSNSATQDYCEVPPEQDYRLPRCSKIADKLCDQLWNSKNEGNLEDGSDKILAGHSDKSELSLALLEDVNALVKNKDRLPQDLRQIGEKLFKKVEDVLKREEDSKTWYREFSKVAWEWDEAIDEVAEARAHRKSPELKSIKKRDLTIEQNGLYRAQYVRLIDEITRAKYSNHPNWVKVKNLFPAVKADLLHEIGKMKVDPSIKKAMEAKVAAVQLSMPSADRRKTPYPTCETPLGFNAIYQPNTNDFTICIGYLNTIQSEAALYLVIAHEISHSIDPYSLIQGQMEKGYVYRTLKKLQDSKGPAFSCENWDLIKSQVFQPTTKIQEPVHPYQSLINCLAPKKELKPFTLENIRPATTMNADMTINFKATYNSLSRLAQPTRQKDGKTEPNPSYLRPDVLLKEQTGGLEPISNLVYDPVYGIFVQSLVCQKNSDQKKFTDPNLSNQAKAALFERAIVETKQVMQTALENQAAYLGREDKFLVPFQLANDSTEHFADWMAARAFPHYLQRFKTQEERQKKASFSVTSFCVKQGPGREVPHLTQIEKKYSTENHPDSQSRRRSFFTREVAKAVGCRLDQECKGDSLQCDF